MGILALTADERVTAVKFTKDTLSVALRDGRTITVPLAWYPRLLDASAAERKNWQIAGGGYGIHWPDIDEDLSTEGLLRGAPAPRQTLKKLKPKNVLGAGSSYVKKTMLRFAPARSVQALDGMLRARNVNKTIQFLSQFHC